MTWWKEAIVYQIYPRSFKDSNGDGIGDLPGIISKLDYIKSLGVDVIWLCPIYQSPNDDNGYDVSDYREIMTDFGNMADFDVLLEGIHQRGMKLIMDIVPNHTSDEHRWFKASSESENSPYRDYYIWKKGKKDQLPNNWPSFFSGNAWDYDEKTQAHYLHLFAKKQPDLNWENPKVRQEIYEIMHFWFRKGIDGFRMDVVSLISKPPSLPNADTNAFTEIIAKYYANGPKVHDYLKEMNHEVFRHYDCMTVGEGPGITLDNALNYVGEDRNELNMVFHFGHMYMDNGPGGKYDPIPNDLVDIKMVFNDWDAKLKGKGWGSIFLGNHDFPRIVSRFGNDKEFWKESAKLLATLILSMRGTPYIYQGDEIGMTNVAFDSIDDYQDIETLNSWKDAMRKGVDPHDFMKLVHQQSRDNARTPFQWSNAKNGGFSDGTPWLKANDNFASINVEMQENDDESVLNYYRKMVTYRKANPTLVYGDYECYQVEHPDLFMFKRWDSERNYWILLNFSEHHHDVDIHLPANLRLEINNYPEPNEISKLRPWEAKIFQEV
jgi:oligo-1,6-glucosidase